MHAVWFSNLCCSTCVDLLTHIELSTQYCYLLLLVVKRLLLIVSVKTGSLFGFFRVSDPVFSGQLHGKSVLGDTAELGDLAELSTGYSLEVSAV